MENCNEYLTYTIATANINGISSATKIAALNSFVHLLDIDVVFLQEVESEHLSLYGYNIFFNIDEKKRGTAIAVKTRFSVTNIEKSLDGRIITARLDGKTTLCNIYAPSGTNNYSEREAFFSNRIPFYLKTATENLIIGGDFNSVERAEDSSGTSNFSPSLKRFTDSLNLVDSWIALNKTKVEFSFIRNTSFSRIDKIYVNERLKGCISSAKFEVTAFSDHKVYLANIKLPKTNTNYSRGNWSLKSIALSDENMIEFQQKWKYWIKQKRHYDSWINWWLDFAKPKITSFFKYKTKLIYDKFKMNMAFCYRYLKLAYDDYMIDKNALSQIHKIKGKMLKLQRDFSSFYYKPNPQFIESETISATHLAVQNTRRKKTNITKICNVDKVVESSYEIKEEITSYYTAMYSSSNVNENSDFMPQKTINLDMPENEHLSDLITEDEIYKAIKQSQSKKSPGLDGLTRDFYLKAWPVIKNEMCLVLNDALQCKIQKKFQDGLIILVRKKLNKNSLEDYRPITLLNFDYKIFTKVLKNRLNVLTPHLLTDYQKCSNKNKTIQEALCEIRDKLTNLVLKNKQAALVAFDLCKAFDRVEPKYLIDIMAKMGLNRRFIELYKKITENSFSRILINGQLSKEIKICRSVRQGDPLSMILFVIYLEPLIQKIAMVLNNENNMLTAFADDITCLIDTKEKFYRIIEIFDRFEKVSGSKLSLTKTEYLPLGLHLNNITEKEEVKILGVIFGKKFNQMLNSNWERQIRKLNIVLYANSNRDINIYESIHFLNSFALSTIWYISAIIPITNKHSAIIKSKLGSFIWKKRKMRVALYQLFLEKKKGGLGLHSPEHRCNALFLNNLLKYSVNTELFVNLVLPNIDNPPNKKICHSLPHIAPQLMDTAYNPKKLELTPVKQMYLNEIKNLPQPYIETSIKANWSMIWININMKQLKNEHKSILYIFVNGKIVNGAHLYRTGRRDNPNCLNCGFLEDLEHMFTKCFKINLVWNSFIRALRRNFEPRRARYLSFSNLSKPSLEKFSKIEKVFILKKLVCYLQYVMETNHDNWSVEGYRFFEGTNLM